MPSANHSPINPPPIPATDNLRLVRERAIHPGEPCFVKIGFAGWALPSLFPSGNCSR